MKRWLSFSITGMFTYAMITGVQNGWLDKKMYEPAAKKAWLAVTNYINENEEVTDICEGTGANNDRDYYLNRKKLQVIFMGRRRYFSVQVHCCKKNKK